LLEFLKILLCLTHLQGSAHEMLSSCALSIWHNFVIVTGTIVVTDAPIVIIRKSDKLLHNISDQFFSEGTAICRSGHGPHNCGPNSVHYKDKILPDRGTLGSPDFRKELS
jgi:hypothetical protein